MGAAPRPSVQKFRVVAEVRSHFRDHLKKLPLYAAAGEVVTLVKDPGAHNNMVVVKNKDGLLFGIRRDNLTPISSSPLF